MLLQHRDQLAGQRALDHFGHLPSRRSLGRRLWGERQGIIPVADNLILPFCPQRVESVHRADVRRYEEAGDRNGRAHSLVAGDPSATSVARSALPQGRCLEPCTATRRRSSIRGHTSVGSTLSD